MKGQRRLSRREADVLLRMAAGESSTASADALSVSRDYINAVRRHARRKLQATSNAHAVSLALQYGLIEIEDEGTASAQPA